MHFGNPIALWSLTVLPVLALVGWLAARRRRRSIEKIGQPALVAQLIPEPIPKWRARRTWAGLWIYALVAFAAARPQYGQTEQTIKRAGVDVIIAIDTSSSMLATDVKPNRLERAKESLKRLVNRFAGDRVGIIAFAGDAFLLCPMTLDHSLASLVLQSVDETSVGVPGTDLAKAIDVAGKAFERGSAGSPVLVLLTDGEDNEGQGKGAAERAAKSGMVIYAIGIGTERGAPVPDATKGYKESEDGTKVISKLDLNGLSAIAKATGGEAFDGGDNPVSAVNSVALRIDRMQKSELESKKLTIYQDRYGWFIAPAIVLLIWLLISRPAQKRELSLSVVEANNVARAK